MSGAIGILGAGAWGTALAVALARAGQDVRLLTRSAARADRLRMDGENRRDLPGIPLPPDLTLAVAPDGLTGCDLVLAAVPAQALRETLRACASAIAPGVPVIICAKGIERGTGAAMSDVVRACCPASPPAALSGPSFAADVGAGLPTAVTLAAEHVDRADAIARRLAAPGLRLYHTDDLVGVELGGAAKNVLAVACGIASGRGLGASAGAALLARAFAELSRFGRARGARPETLMGLSGLGDLVLTCNSPQSRNFAFGLALGRGVPLADAAGGRLVEGVATAPILRRAAAEAGVDMPIVASVDAVLAGRLSIAAAIDALLARPARPET